MISAAKNKGPKACTTCAKAKARCIPGPAPDICERCHRLNKACSSQTPAPPRRRKEMKPTKVAELEKRLEDLTSRLDSVSRPQQPTPPDSAEAAAPASPAQRFLKEHSMKWRGGLPFYHLFPAEFPEDADATAAAAAAEAEGNQPDPLCPTGFPEAIFPSSARDNPRESASPTGAGESDGLSMVAHPPGPRQPDHGSSCWPTPAPKPQQAEVQQESLWPLPAEAEQQVSQYMAHSMFLFPFIVLPPSTTEAQLRQYRPFLWKAIVMQSFHSDGARQMLLGNILAGELTEAAITKPQKTLDLLQGLQILLAWFHYNINSFQLLNLLFLTRSICSSLGLSEPPRGTKQAAELTSADLERMRAYAGTYYLSTLVCTTAKKADALMSSAYLDTCCQILEQRMEYQTDGNLVNLIRIQQLAQSISLTFAFRGSGVQPDLPVNIIVENFQQQLQAFKTLLPERLKENQTIATHYSMAEVLLYETSLVDGQLGSFVSAPVRLEMLRSCLHAAKAFLQNRFASPIDDQPRFLCLNSLEYMYAFVTALKLMTLQLPGWDCCQVRRELDFDELLDRQIHDMHKLSERRRKKTEVESTDDPFLRLGKKIELVKAALLSELDNLAPLGATPAEQRQQQQQQQQPMSLVSPDFMQDVTNDVDAAPWPSLFNDLGWEATLHAPTFVDFWAPSG